MYFNSDVRQSIDAAKTAFVDIRFFWIIRNNSRNDTGMARTKAPKVQVS